MLQKRETMETFTSIRFKNETAESFKKYSKCIATTHTEALELVLQFFAKSGLHPKDDVGPLFKKLERVIVKECNTIIAILKNIERTQLKPTHALVMLLYEAIKEEKEAMEKMKRPRLVEKKRFDKNRFNE